MSHGVYLSGLQIVLNVKSLGYQSGGFDWLCPLVDCRIWYLPPITYCNSKQKQVTTYTTAHRRISSTGPQQVLQTLIYPMRLA